MCRFAVPVPLRAPTAPTRGTSARGLCADLFLFPETRDPFRDRFRTPPPVGWSRTFAGLLGAAVRKRLVRLDTTRTGPTCRTFTSVRPRRLRSEDGFHLSGPTCRMSPSGTRVDDETTRVRGRQYDSDLFAPRRAHALNLKRCSRAPRTRAFEFTILVRDVLL